MSIFARRHIEQKRTWGRIVNVTADCSWGSPGEVSYRVSKHGLESYTRSGAAELGPYGITVNVVSPGPVDEVLPKLYLQGLAEGDFDLALRGLLGEEPPVSLAPAQLSASSVWRMPPR